jgi:sulfatase modifying factor 1
MSARRMMLLSALAPVVLLCGAASPAMSYGDHNGNGTVDLADYAQFPACMAGPGGGLGTSCDIFDFDSDADVDAFDFAAFQGVFGTSVGMMIETVTVGNPGNDDDTYGDGYGGVDYVYNVGKYEVTAGQYAAFLNGVADTDTYGLYSTSMWSSSFGCKIQRSGSSGSYMYGVDPDWADRPVNYVSWGDAARFANWLHNGQPTGAQDLTTTEDGSYYLNGATSAAELMAITREPDATWVIPSEDEWYKAAYHYNDGVTGNYFDYPTSSDSEPSNDLIDPDPGNNATFYDSGYTIGSPYYRTEVGAHENSDSPYGTFDQGGNVWEWNEAVMGSYRGLRGGSFYIHDYGLHAAIRLSYDPSNQILSIGFRVAEVP